MELELDLFEDIKPSAMKRLLRSIVTKGIKDKKSTAAKRGGKCEDCAASGDDSMLEDDDSILEHEEENDKMVDLQRETRGKPAPIPVQETDFKEGAARRMVRRMKGRRK